MGHSITSLTFTRLPRSIDTDVTIYKVRLRNTTIGYVKKNSWGRWDAFDREGVKLIGSDRTRSQAGETVVKVQS